MSRARPGAAVLCIGGTDSGAGAGLLRDCITVEALGVTVRAAVTAVTAQDDHAVTASVALPVDTVVAQIERAGAVQAVKIGMLGTAEIVEAVSGALPEGFRVLDPVLLTSSGHPLLDQPGVSALLSRLVPRVDLLTPNLPELTALARQIGCGSTDAGTCAAALLRQGAGAVLVKGGHDGGAQSADRLYRRHGPVLTFHGARLRGRLRGTGCRLASAIACHVALGAALPQAVGAAKAYVRQAFAETAG